MIVPHMTNLKVNIVLSNIFKASVQKLMDMLFAADSVFDFFLASGKKLCSNNDFITSCKCSQSLSCMLLTCTVLITCGSIKEVYAQFQCSLNHCIGTFFIHSPCMTTFGSISKTHTTKTDSGYMKVKISYKS